MLVKFEVGEKYVHNWYTRDSSSVFTFVRPATSAESGYTYSNPAEAGWFVDGKGKPCLLTLEQMRPFAEAPPPSFKGRFLVWSPTGVTNPTVLHATHNEARKVAREMTTRHGGEFYTVQVMAGYRRPAPTIEEL